MRGLINVQYAVQGTTVYVIEANPRASRTVPFVAKATGVPLAKVATRVMLGATLAELRDEGLLRRQRARPGARVAVKEAVLPFNRFPEVDPALGPEMRSTGEVMGIDATFGRAFYKAELAAGTELPATARCSCRSPTPTSRPGSSSPSASRARHRRRRHPGHGRLPRNSSAIPVDEVVAKVSEGGGKTAVDLIGVGRRDIRRQHPEGRGDRTDGERSARRQRCTRWPVSPPSPLRSRPPRASPSTGAALKVRTLQETTAAQRSMAARWTCDRSGRSGWPTR